jgi:pimeloyl-ACP methyl ester carboxylesterase
MMSRHWKLISAVLVVLVAGSWFAAYAQNRSAASRAMPPKAIPTFSNENIARMAYFYAGGKYVGTPGEEVMGGAMYTEVWVPRQIRSPYPIVFFAGAGQTGVDWRQTPDGRPGWAYHLIDQGYVLYMTDYPARGRSPYVPGIDGSLTIRTAPQLEEIWTNVKEKSDYFWKDNHTQWPGTGKMGDPIFDAFAKTQVQYLGGGDNRGAEIYREAGIALLDTIGTPVILFTHSMGGGVGWSVADARPKLVQGIVTVEPGGGIDRQMLTYDPPITAITDLKTTKEAKGERPGENACVLQQAPGRKLANLQHLRILDISGDGGYHRIGDACPPKWLNQAGVKTDFVRLEDVGIRGNGHEMFFEKNSDQIITFIADWMQKNIQ